MSEPPENPRPLFADEELAPRRPLTGPGAPADPAPPATPLPPEYYTEPAPSRRPLGVAVIVLAVLALILGGTTVWAFTSNSSKISDLNAQLDSANSQLGTATAQVDSLNSQVTDLQGQLDKATQSGTDQTKKIDKLTAQVKKWRTLAKASVPTSDLPVVVYFGSANKKLKSAFQTQLVTPMAADAVSNGNTLLTLAITVPANNGDPYSYTAVYADGQSTEALYGAKGSPLPLWTPS